MKKLILSLAIVSMFSLAFLACNSTKNVSGSADSTIVDTTISVPMDTTAKPDTMKTMPPDTTTIPPTL